MGVTKGRSRIYIIWYMHERMCKMKLPLLVKWAQDTRLILHPNQHRKHHHTFDCQYSLLNGSFQMVEDMGICLAFSKPLYDIIANYIMNKRNITVFIINWCFRPIGYSPTNEFRYNYFSPSDCWVCFITMKGLMSKG